MLVEPVVYKPETRLLKSGINLNAGLNYRTANNDFTIHRQNQPPAASSPNKREEPSFKIVAVYENISSTPFDYTQPYSFVIPPDLFNITKLGIEVKVSFMDPLLIGEAESEAKGFLSL